MKTATALGIAIGVSLVVFLYSGCMRAAENPNGKSLPTWTQEGLAKD
jgi:hypothetical protein